MISPREVLRLLQDRLFVFALTALFVILVLDWWDWHEFQQGAETVRESSERLRYIEHILSTMKDAETGQRGYIISGNESYLDPYYFALREIPKQLADPVAKRLRNSSHREAFTLLEAAIDRRLSLLAGPLQFRREGHFDLAANL